MADALTEKEVRSYLKACELTGNAKARGARLAREWLQHREGMEVFAAFVRTAQHSRSCSLDRLPGDAGDCCDCGLRVARMHLADAVA